MPETTRLFHLASLAGIEPGYWDISGTWHGLLPDTVRALLAAMGLAAETAAGVEQSIDDLEKRPWRRTLPPVIVNEERTSISFTFHVPEYWARRSIEWIISLEGGETVSGILDGH